jgi:hypothetical protein
MQSHPQRRLGQPGAGPIYAANTTLPPAWQEHPRTLATFNLTRELIDKFDGHPRVISEVRLLSGTQPPRPEAAWRRRRHKAAGALGLLPGQELAVATGGPPATLRSFRVRDLKLAVPMLVVVVVVALQVVLRQSRYG